MKEIYMLSISNNRDQFDVINMIFRAQAMLFI